MQMIAIWRYDGAPAALRELKPFGSSDTWVVQAPASLSDEVQEFLNRNSATDIEVHSGNDGTAVFFCRAPRRPAYHAGRSGAAK